MHNKSIYVGIDDFGYKKGKDYMSVVVDQMTHMPIALLEDRTSPYSVPRPVPKSSSIGRG